MPYLPIQLSGHSFDPASREVPAPLILSRVAQSSFLREPEHPIFYAEALLDHWQRCGAPVLNGAEDPRDQLLEGAAAVAPYLARPGRSRDAHRSPDSGPARSGGGHCASRCSSRPISAARARRSSAIPPPRSCAPRSPTERSRSRSTRSCSSRNMSHRAAARSFGSRLCERDFLYAIEVESGGDNFDLCPADACVASAGPRGHPHDCRKPSTGTHQGSRKHRACGLPVRRRDRGH